MDDNCGLISILYIVYIRERSSGFWLVLSEKIVLARSRPDMAFDLVHCTLNLARSDVCCVIMPAATMTALEFYVKFTCNESMLPSCLHQPETLIAPWWKFKTTV